MRLLFANGYLRQNKVPSKYSQICADVLLSADELDLKHTDSVG